MSIIGGIDLGNLTDYLFMFADGSTDANWQGATKGFIGDVAVDGIKAKERTSGTVPYAGTIYTNDTTLSAWQAIINDNIGQATGVTGQTTRIASLESDLVSAFQQINALPPTPGFESVSSTSLDGLNTQNGINEVYVINITSGLNFSTKIDITGDPGDVYILRWDTDGDPTNGYQGQVKPQSGGAIVPHGGLTPANFINVAGDITSSGGGTNPAPPYPQGPRYNNGTGALITGGADWNGGGFFTGYWLTTGSPDNFNPTTGLYYGESSSMSNGIFVGGWYTINTKFSMTSGTSGVYVSPNEATFPSIHVIKYVSPDGGVTWFDANTPTGPNVMSNVNPQFRFVATNTGNVTLTNVQITDDVYGLIGSAASLAPGATLEFIIVKPWAEGQQVNTATATGVYQSTTVTDTDPAYWFGVELAEPAIRVFKDVSPDSGVTWLPADSPPGPNVVTGTNPQFRFTVTNTGNVTLTNININDDVYGFIGTVASLAPGATSAPFIITRPWALGQQVNIATVTCDQGVTDSNPAYWFGVTAPTAAIQVVKEVSPDNGVTWFDANTPTGPDVPSNISPRFRFTVTNIGNITLTNVNVNDDVYGFIGTIASLAPGASSTPFVITRPWLAGQQVNTATATSDQGVEDTDEAFWYGIAAPLPSVSIVKEVSPDNGMNWFDANTPPGPPVPVGTNPRFRYTVTNTGEVTLTTVQVTDDKLGLIGTVASLAPGESTQFVVTGTWAFGQQENTATVTTDQQVTDTDLAHYVGTANPRIDVEKLISVDGGLTYVDADAPPYPTLVAPMNPMYKFVVRNTGDVPLTQVSLTDTTFGVISVGGTLAPGASFEAFRTGVFAVGTHCNTATVTGAYVTTVGVIGVEDEDSACYNGTEHPSILIEKFVSVDNGATWIHANMPPGPLLPPGVTPRFKYVVTNNGTATLTNITVVDDVYGLIGTLPTLAPNDTHEWIIP